MIIPVAAAIPTMAPTGLAYWGIFIIRYDIIIDGNAIAIKSPASVMV